MFLKVRGDKMVPLCQTKVQMFCFEKFCYFYLTKGNLKLTALM